MRIKNEYKNMKINIELINKTNNELLLRGLDFELSYIIRTEQNDCLKYLKGKLSDTQCKELFNIIRYLSLEQELRDLIPLTDKDKAEHEVKLFQTKKEFERTFYENLEKKDKREFLRLLSEIAFHLCIYKNKKNLKWLEGLAKFSTAALNAKVRKLKWKRKGEITKELLRIFWGEKIEDINAVAKEYEEEMSKYRDYDQSKIIEFSCKCLKGKNLSDRLLVDCVVKQAQEGNEKALSKLAECYKVAAKKRALEFIRQKARGLKGVDSFNYSGPFSEDEIKSVSFSILTKLLAGDRPEFFLRYFAHRPKDKPGVEDMINRDPNILFQALRGWHLTLITAIKLFEREEKEFRRRIKNMHYRSRLARKKGQTETEIIYYVKILSLSKDRMSKLEPSTFLATQIFDPYNFIVHLSNFNRSAYRPKSKTNLTTWLFGIKGKLTAGAFWRKMNDWYKSETETKAGKRYIKSGDYFKSLPLELVKPFWKPEEEDNDKESENGW